MAKIIGVGYPGETIGSDEVKTNMLQGIVTLGVLGGLGLLALRFFKVGK